ncbi:MAG: hypothetical protein ABIR63_05120 [Sphingomicrobium sp.]
MRSLIAVPALLALGACQVSKDAGNDTVAVTYNGEVAADAASDVGNTAENVGDAIANDVQREADKVQNTDVNLTVNDHDADDGNMAANKH